MRCAKCGAKAREELRSPLGEVVCGSCYSTVMGAAAGVMSGMAGGGVGGAIAGAGMLAWIRKAFGKDEPPKRAAADTDESPADQAPADQALADQRQADQTQA